MNNKVNKKRTLEQDTKDTLFFISSLLAEIVFVENSNLNGQ